MPLKKKKEPSPESERLDPGSNFFAVSALGMCGIRIEAHALFDIEDFHGLHPVRINDKYYLGFDDDSYQSRHYDRFCAYRLCDRIDSEVRREVVSEDHIP